MNKIHRILLVLIIITFLIPVGGCKETQKTANAASEENTKAIESPKLPESAKPASSLKSVLALKPVKQKTSQKVPAKTEGKQPSVKFEETVHDFGVVGPGKYVTCNFKFKNVGDATLKMTRKPHAGCRCTVPKLDKMEYAPGESGSIKVTYHTITTEGDSVKHITVYTNDPVKPETNLTLKAKIELAVTANPKTFELSLKKENGGIKPITVEAKDGKEFSITSVTSTKNTITADFDPDEKATKFVLNPIVDMTKLKDQISGNININISHPDTKQLLLRYNAKPLFKVTNQRIYLLKPDPKKPEIRNIMVMSNYGQEVEIESVKSAKKFIKVLEQQKKGKSVLLKVQVTPPPKTEGVRAFYDILTVKIKGGETVKITASGTYPYVRPKNKPAKPSVKPPVKTPEKNN